MTVCIGALCADAEGNQRSIAVVATDRMVTWGFTEFEHEEPKMNFLGDKAVILAAGDSLRAGKVVSAVKAAMSAHSVVSKRPRSPQAELDRFGFYRMIDLKEETWEIPGSWK